jgi:hypothetical protein
MDKEAMILHPPGTVAVPAGEFSRYHQFTNSIAGLLKPPNTKLQITRGLSVTHNLNSMVRELHGDWLWVMGDDHSFSDDALMRLLDRQVDVIVPLCWRRSPPFQLVVFTHQNEDDSYQPINPGDLPDEGIFEIHAAGSAGMLVRKNVLDAIGDPWFTTVGEHQNEDLEFCRKVREAGFKIYADSEVFIGHHGQFSVWPARINGTWGGMLVFDEDHKIFLASNEVQDASPSIH